LKGWVAVLATLVIGVPAASAIDVPLPGSPETAAVGAPPEPAPVAVAPPPSSLLGSRALRVGSRGADVRELQRILRKRGLKVTVDGAYGKVTSEAVKVLQRRFKMRANGVANAAFLKRLGVKIRSVRSGTSPATPAEATDYPLAGPNAAKAKYLQAFPVGGKHTYFNDFGAPRSQGSHQGNDIMAARGVPVRAVAAGQIKRMTRVETGLGGIWIWLLDTRGNEYYYAHLTSITNGLEAGSAVTVGQVIGTVGNTGDARYGATHLHFEIHPGGGGAVNPYTDLLAIDPEPPAR
jgi:murein DD-endopeptidase MepM/ murein hydrolase activator NlpD